MRATGLTQKAYDYLSEDDRQEILDSLPSIIEESDIVNSMNEELVWVENLNDVVHPSFLIIEP